MNAIQFHARPWAELTRDELLQLLILRSQIFVIEQRCFYQDPDDIDRRSCHLLGYGADRSLIAVARWFPDADSKEIWRFGRMAVATAERGRGFGHAALRFALSHIGHREVHIHAQTHLAGFYAKHGFEVDGEEFIEAEIAHLPMRRKASSPAG